MRRARWRISRMVRKMIRKCQHVLKNYNHFSSFTTNNDVGEGEGGRGEGEGGGQIVHWFFIVKNTDIEGALLVSFLSIAPKNLKLIFTAEYTFICIVGCIE
jgi:hypothetical protein